MVRMKRYIHFLRPPDKATASKKATENVFRGFLNLWYQSTRTGKNTEIRQRVYTIHFRASINGGGYMAPTDRRALQRATEAARGACGPTGLQASLSIRCQSCRLRDRSLVRCASVEATKRDFFKENSIPLMRVKLLQRRLRVLRMKKITPMSEQKLKTHFLRASKSRCAALCRQ